MPRRRRQEQGLERVLGAPALFATAYGNVGSSIYYALGVTAAFALGLTPLVFVLAGLIFAATAATYAEGTVRFPEAGGSASFARHAFDEVVSFGAGWAQMLNYVITVAISAFFVPHYLSIFWEPLRENPWDVAVGAVVVAVLVAVNIVGVKEAAKLNVLLAVVDFATQALLVLLGFVLIFSPGILLDNVTWGVAPTWQSFLLAIPVAMIAYTGIETISNLSEEARDPARDIPQAIRLVAVAVYAIYFTLPAIALSAMPVSLGPEGHTTALGLPPEEGGYANDPVLGLVDNLGVEGGLLRALELYVGLLAATILLIAANAGVIGASRITYSMAGYRQLPGPFRRLHRRFTTPWLALVLFAGVAPVLALLPGQTDFLGTMYSFGAMLSFTIAHASIVALRVRRRGEELVYRSRPNLRVGGVDLPLFAVLGGLATGAAWLVVVVQEPLTRWAGLLWLAAGFALYAVYRLRVARLPLRETHRAPALVLGEALEVQYRSIVVPVVRSAASEEALVTAARLAAERRSRVAVLHVIEVPMELPLAARMPEREREANELLDDARALVESHGVRAVTRLERARSAGEAIVADAAAREAQLVVMGTSRRPAGRRAPAFGRTVRHVVRHAPCRVIVASRAAVAA
ncbi:universal stress protein [Miltoncostaea marina]|uniref:universal stress protein n=1 Tax=Miltoncostaea marina TaxID=2843215 RepID=UPI001C3E6D0A|nr:universal stress protein [Miltoncostaea marina]